MSAINVMAITASPTASASSRQTPSPLRARSPAASSTGATIRSWNSNTENATRPDRLVSRPCSPRSCRTTAVDDIAKQRPRMTAPGPLMPAAVAIKASANAEMRNCEAPRPKT
jgi:hypothetical protein